jgi:putative ABC transport system ATP-binding protein
MIRCIDVRKVYRQGSNEIIALDDVSLDIARGEFAVIMGPSGSGKSTLLHLIGGLDRPTSGELLVDQRLVGQMADDQVTLFRRTRIGFVFQFFNLLPTLTALENVALPFVLDGRSKEEAEQRAAMLLDKVGLQNRQDHLPEEMSGGEIQRIAVARALAFDPPILLADEPTGNLDSKTGESILSLLRDQS